MWSLIELIHVIVRTIIFRLSTKSCMFCRCKRKVDLFFKHTFIYTFHQLIKWLPILFTVDLVCVCVCTFVSFPLSLSVSGECMYLCGVANKICTGITSKIYFVYESQINLTFCRLDFGFHSAAVCYCICFSLARSLTHSLWHSLQIETFTLYKLIKRLPFRQYSFMIWSPVSPTSVRPIEHLQTDMSLCHL